MSSAGHILDMISRMKYNRTQQPSKRRKFGDHKREGMYSVKKIRSIRFRKISKEKLDAVIHQIDMNAERERKKGRIVSIILIVLAIAGSVFILRKMIL